MAHTLDTTLRIPAGATATSTSNPVTGTYTCGASATVLVIGIMYAGSSNRTGGAPTFNGLTMTQANSVQRAATTPECTVEVWYLLNPPTGSAYTLNVPNGGGVATFVSAASFSAQTGYNSVLDVANGGNNTSTNPTLSVTTTVNGDAIFAALANGANTWNPTGRSGTQIGDYDVGTWGGGTQYVLQGTLGAQAMSWTFATSEDWGEVVVSFKETLVERTGSTSVTLGALTSSASGTVANPPVSGSASITLADSTDFALGTQNTATPGASVSDNFNRANADSLGANWGGPFLTGKYPWGIETNRAFPNYISTGGAGTITISTPVQYQVFQRGAGNLGDVRITGTYTGSPTAIRARLAGGPWQTIAFYPTGGVYAGYLFSQPGGQGTLEVSFTNNTSVTASVANIGVGEIFIIAGQSNAVGMTAGNQSWSHASLTAVNFANDYTWKVLADPVDSNSGQVDAVSSDPAGGSYYPLLATTLMAGQSVPIAFVPCAKVGTRIAEWQPGANQFDRTTLFGSMAYRIQTIGGKARCILWWQGESDVIDVTTRTNYANGLNAMINAVYNLFGIKTMPCKLENMTTAGVWSSSYYTTINLAIGDVWSGNSNCVQGPDLSVWQPSGDIHYNVSEAPTIRNYWWSALQAAYGW